MFKRMTFALVLAAALGLASTTTSAALTVRVQDVVVTGSDTNAVNGFFDVFVEVIGQDPTPPITGWQALISLSPSSAGVDFTGVQAADVGRDYIFGTPQNFLALIDTADQIGVIDNLDPGSIVPVNEDGLARVAFSVQPGTYGVFDVTLDRIDTVLSDDTSPTPLPVPLTLDDGTITIRRQSIGVVPEPATMTTAAVALLFVLVVVIIRPRPLSLPLTRRV